MIKMPISNPVILTMDLPLMEDSRLQFVDISGSQSEPVARQRQKTCQSYAMETNWEIEQRFSCIVLCSRRKAVLLFLK